MFSHILEHSSSISHFHIFYKYISHKIPIHTFHVSLNSISHKVYIYKTHVQQNIYIYAIHITNTIFHKIYIFLTISTHQTLFQELITKSPFLWKTYIYNAKSPSYERCKVEFIQSFCWLYSMPNLPVIQYLETLYLGGNHVRVLRERVWRKAQKCALKKGLVTGKSPKLAHAWSM